MESSVVLDLIIPIFLWFWVLLGFGLVLVVILYTQRSNKQKKHEQVQQGNVPLRPTVDGLEPRTSELEPERRD